MNARIAVLISGRGRNLQRLLEHAAAGRLGGEIVGVISNVPHVSGLDYARAAGVPALTVAHKTFLARPHFEAALGRTLRELKPDIVVLAGFMRVLSDEFVRGFRGRLLNIHPSLLPKYPGLKTHQRVLDAGDAEHGATVHFVTEQLDGGPAIVQGRFSVRPEDTAETLAQRVMQDVELKIYPQAVAWLARGDIALDGERVLFRGKPLNAPLGLDSLEPEFR